MNTIATSAAAALVLALQGAADQPPAAEPAPATEIPITGPTTAKGSAARDAMLELMGYSGGALKCGAVTGIEASPLAEGWTPKDPNFRIGPAGARYERWNVSMCGRVEPFLVVFWEDPKAGPQFVVGHPFPKDGGSVAKP